MASECHIYESFFSFSECKKLYYVYIVLVLRQIQRLSRGADKSLARPGKKQATATEDFDVHISYLLS
jgi:hypothetical protein